MPALYFSLRFFSGRSRTDFAFSMVLTLLATLAYSIQGLYLIFLEAALWLGCELEKKLKIRFPKIELKIGKMELKSIAYLIIPCIAFSAFVFLRFGISTRGSWISEWISSLLASCPGYPCIWTQFLIVDNALVIVAAALGVIYLAYTKNWKILSLFLGGSLIVLAGTLFQGSGIVRLTYRFYTTFFALLVLPAAVIIQKLIAKNRKAGMVLLIAAMVLQLSIIGIFFSKIGPAITHDEFRAAGELSKLNGSVLYVNNVQEEGNFRDFKWIVVFAKSDNYTVHNSLGNPAGFSYIFVQDKSQLNATENGALKAWGIMYDGEKARIYGA